MEKKQLASLIDHKRWLLNSGLADDGIQNDLFTYGAICHPRVKSVDCNIDVLKKLVVYAIYLDDKDYNTVQKFARLSKSKGLFGMWRFRNMLKKHGNLHIHAILQRFIKDYCGPKWSAEVTVKRFKEYEEPENGAKSGAVKISADAHQQDDKRRGP